MRRVLALVLPQLACEIAREKRPPGAAGESARPLAVLLEPHAPGTGEEEPKRSALIDAVSDEARRYGVRPGQRVAEASALASHLEVGRVTYAELDLALGRIAELALAFGTPASIRLARAPEPRRRAGRSARPARPTRPEPARRHPAGEEPFDTVWVDVSASAHLFGGEEGLLEEVCERISALGHRVRAAIADGPRIAQALARFGGGATVAAPGEGARALAPLPVSALPLDWQTSSFLVRVGVMTVGDLARLPKASAVSRLSGAGAGASADEILALAAGFDPRPLVSFELPRSIVEAIDLDEGVAHAEALVFVLRGMVARASARLSARGEAASRLELRATYDASVLRLRQGEAEGAPPELSVDLDLPAPLAGEADLLRPLRAKLERAALLAPVVSLRLEVPRIVRAERVQLDLSRRSALGPEALPALLAELAAELGEVNVGLLEAREAQAPENRSRLVPVGADLLASGPERPPLSSAHEASLLEPSRFLPEPLAIGRTLRKGAAVAIDKHLFVVEEVEPAARLDGVGWFTDAPVSRDYARVWLASGAQGSRSAVSATALVFVDRKTGEAYLQGWCE